MIIYFLRHANAGETKKDPKRDEQRALDREGIEQCYTVARFFGKLNVVPDLILSSPLKRAAQTASLVANELGYDDRMKLMKALRPEATYADFRPMLKSHIHAENVIVVGHNPNLSHFIGHIISESGQRAEVDIKKAGVAKVEFDGKRGRTAMDDHPEDVAGDGEARSQGTEETGTQAAAGLAQARDQAGWESARAQEAGGQAGTPEEVSAPLAPDRRRTGNKLPLFRDRPALPGLRRPRA